MRHVHRLFGAGLVAMLAACAAPLPTTNPADLPSPRPGLLPGYLPVQLWVNRLALRPAPPQAGSAAQAADDAAYRAAIAAKGSPRWQLAERDAELQFPRAADAFACALGVPIRAETSPHLSMLMRRTLADAGLATYTAKDHYQRPRPFMVLGGEQCTPKEDAWLRKDGSYPSGHAAIGWTWALVLSEVAPDRTNALMRRGYEFAQSRVACGVHWESDVARGRDVAAAVVAQLHGNADFKAQLAEARKEVAQARAAGLAPPAAECAAEAATLKR
jgi:acid phosphatase (class A)